MPGYWTRLLDRRVERRRVLAGASSAGVAALLAACAGGGKSSPAPQTPKDTSGLLSNPTDSTNRAKRGGVLQRNGTGDGSLDPNLSIGGISTLHEIANTRLVTLKLGHLAPAQDSEIAPFSPLRA